MSHGASVPGAALAAGGPAAGAALLEVRDLTVRHGQLVALQGVSLALGPGEVVAIIGANGAGKSTLLRTIAGLHRPVSGTVHLEGRDISHETPEKRVAAGVVLVPEGRRLFASLDLEENLLTGCYLGRPGAWDMARVFELFPWMAERRHQPASQLSGGEQQAVAIARALLANPKVLLLDEPSLGLAPLALKRIYSVLPDLVASGMGVLLVEQDVRQALKVSNKLQCLLEGHQALEGAPSELTVEMIEAAYFGIASREGVSA
jgi:branched-chain amino acid transport system ATP-binding protein